MSLTFNSANPHLHSATFKQKIDQGHIVTWKYDQDGDFTHNTDQMEEQGVAQT